MAETGNQGFNFVESEHKILAFWQEKGVFEKSLEQTKSGAPYIFYDGPPFATGLPHHGHLVGGTLKDIVPRYFTMKGRYVDRRFGWDCHGLPIEHEINKDLGMSAMQAVAELGVKKYNDACRGIVQKFTKEWEKTVNRMGRWVSFERQYKTMDLPFMESVWWVFKQLWDQDLVYQDTKVMPFSTGLGTVLSNFEAGQNYQDVQDPAVTVLFKIKDREEYIAAWTTTPWTLPSNLGLCVNKEIDYVLFNDEGKKIWMAKERLAFYSKKLKKELEENIEKEAKGTELVGLKYEPLLPFFETLSTEGAFQVHADDYVTTSDGTGIVHIAPAFGEDDERVLRDAGVKAKVCPVDNEGKFTDEVPDFKGEYVKDADKGIIKRLKDEGKLYLQDTIVHSYPFCDRSKTPLIYKAIPTWFINVEKVKPKMIAANKEINWVPSHLKEGRFGKWIENAKDWAVSRNRVWGTPIPIWHNEESNKYICIGSREELAKYTGTTLDDLHREFVDELTFKVEGEPGEYKRITEVLDCWFESGSMPYAQLHFPFENEDVFKAGFPAEFIAEGLDQTRGWFYTLTVLAAALYEKPAFKNVIVNGLVLAADGKKMSKSLRNYTAPDTLMEEYGADALRLFLINSALVKAEDLKFSDDGVKDMVRKALLPWYNSFKFFSTYVEVDGWKPKHKLADFKPAHILDAWVLSKLQTLVSTVDEEMNKYQLYNVVPALFDFIDDLTNWYIRLNRKRFWAEDSKDKDDAYHTLYFTLETLNKLMAPFTPFLSEALYLELQKLSGEGKESVHLCAFPEAQTSLQDSVLEDAVKRMQEIILLGRQKRTQEKVKVKIPLRTLTIIHPEKKVTDALSKLEDSIKTELNVKEIQYDSDELKYIKLYALPNSPVLGKKLGKEFGKYVGLIKSLKSDDIAKFEDKGTIKLNDRDFELDEILIFREAKEGTDALSNRFISINLSCELDDELINEGLAREVVNRIQKTRKDLDLKVDQRIKITCYCSDELQKVITSFKDHICSETLVTDLGLASVNEKPSEANDHKINDFEFGLVIH